MTAQDDSELAALRPEEIPIGERKARLAGEADTQWDATIKNAIESGDPKAALAGMLRAARIATGLPPKRLDSLLELSEGTYSGMENKKMPVHRLLPGKLFRLLRQVNDDWDISEKEKIFEITLEAYRIAQGNAHWKVAHETREIVAAVRLACGFTQPDLAEKLGVGRKVYRRMETGEEPVVEFTDAQLAKVAELGNAYAREWMKGKEYIIRECREILHRKEFDRRWEEIVNSGSSAAESVRQMLRVMREYTGLNPDAFTRQCNLSTHQLLSFEAGERIPPSQIAARVRRYMKNNHAIWFDTSKQERFTMAIMVAAFDQADIAWEAAASVGGMVRAMRLAADAPKSDFALYLRRGLGEELGEYMNEDVYRSKEAGIEDKFTHKELEIILRKAAELRPLWVTQQRMDEIREAYNDPQYFERKKAQGAAGGEQTAPVVEAASVNEGHISLDARYKVLKPWEPTAEALDVAEHTPAPAEDVVVETVAPATVQPDLPEPEQAMQEPAEESATLEKPTPEAKGKRIRLVALMPPEELERTRRNNLIAQQARRARLREAAASVSAPSPSPAEPAFQRESAPPPVIETPDVEVKKVRPPARSFNPIVERHRAAHAARDIQERDILAAMQASHEAQLEERKATRQTSAQKAEILLQQAQARFDEAFPPDGENGATTAQAAVAVQCMMDAFAAQIRGLNLPYEDKQWAYDLTAILRRRDSKAAVTVDEIAELREKPAKASQALLGALDSLLDNRVSGDTREFWEDMKARMDADGLAPAMDRARRSVSIFAGPGTKVNGSVPEGGQAGARAAGGMKV